MSFPPANRSLGELQEFVLELSDQLPLVIRAAPMRLLHIDAVLRGWKTGIKVRAWTCAGRRMRAHQGVCGERR